MWDHVSDPVLDYICLVCHQSTADGVYRPCDHGSMVPAVVTPCPNIGYTPGGRFRLGDINAVRRDGCHGMGSIHHHFSLGTFHVTVPDHICVDPVECDSAFTEEWTRRHASQIRRRR